jgi:hypothetical protein
MIELSHKDSFTDIALKLYDDTEKEIKYLEDTQTDKVIGLKINIKCNNIISNETLMNDCSMSTIYLVDVIKDYIWDKFYFHSGIVITKIDINESYIFAHIFLPKEKII